MTRWHYKRVVIDLHRSATDQAAIALAGELAAAMGLELLGRFIADPGLANLAGLPFAREFRPLEREWRKLDPERTTAELDIAAAAARRLFQRAAGGAAGRFELVRDEAADGFHPAEDIAVLRYAECLGESCALMLDEALRHAAAVLIVPGEPKPRRGPVIALAASAEDPALDVAAALAEAAGDRAMRFDLHGHAGPLPEGRLLVVSRHALADDTLLALATRRRVPVLVLQRQG
ncbi:hypothetical protein [Acidocella sp. KAb 2-4]|uniref:hypothetical protein n=1 Tax=Acidocella sp. KAb 2-4 TaxID=2885158 RepID=UPI001D060DD7|nr:hypothetical protein [Acidocella sp. KAb 2-4]MCB5945498.1 hypothetical protein [Acidocella sp. KAb 2-4]